MSEKKATSKRRLSVAIRQQAAQSGVDHLIGIAERPSEERGLSMSQQIKKLNQELSDKNEQLYRVLAENEELRKGASGATSSASNGANEMIETQLRELTSKNAEQASQLEKLQAENDALAISFNQRLQEVEDMEDLIGQLEEEIESSKGSSEASTLRARLEIAEENASSLKRDKEYANAQTKEFSDQLAALEKEFKRANEKVAELTKELVLVKNERDSSKANETETLTKMRHENAALMSEAVRTTALLGTLQEDIVTQRDNYTKAQIQLSELRRGMEEKDREISKLNDKIAFLQSSTENLNAEKVSLTNKAVEHLDLLRRLESDYYKKKEELEDLRRKFQRSADELKALRDERDLLASSANPEHLSALQELVDNERSDNERLRSRISELQRALSSGESSAAALRDDLRTANEEINLLKSQNADVNKRSAEAFDELSKLRIQYSEKKEKVVELTKEVTKLKQNGGPGGGADADEISRLIDEREDLLDTINAMESQIEEQNASLADAAKDVDFLEQKALKLEHNLEKMSRYRAQNKELNSQLQQLRQENNELVKQVAQFQRTKESRLRDGGLPASGPSFLGRGMIQSMGMSNRSLMSDIYPASVYSAATSPPVMRLGSTDSNGQSPSIPTSGQSATNKKLKITQEKLYDERRERKAAQELLKLVLIEVDQLRSQTAEPPDKVDKALITAQWIQMNGRTVGQQDIGYNDGEAAVGLAVMEDDDASVGLRAKMSKKSGDRENLEETEVAAFTLATEGLEHLLLGWNILKHYPHKPTKSPSPGTIVADVFTYSLFIRTDGSDMFMGADKERRRRLNFDDITGILKGIRECQALQASAQTVEKQCITIISQSGQEKHISVLECKTEAERNACYNAIVCMVAQTNKIFNPEALQIIQISSANLRKKKSSMLSPGVSQSGGMRSLQSESDVSGTAMNRPSKKVAQANKLNHSTMKTLAAMGHFDASAGVEKILENHDEDDGDRGSEGKSQTIPVSEDGKKPESKKTSVLDDEEEEEQADTFTSRISHTFSAPRPSGMKREASAQIMDMGDIYRGKSKEFENESAQSPSARPSLLAMGSSSYNLTSNPLAMVQAADEADDDLQPRASLTGRNSMTGTEPKVRRTSVTMAGIGKTQQPINLKGRRKSVVK